MSVIVMVMTDGRREYITEAMESLLARVSGEIEQYVIHDDSGDASYRGWLAQTFPEALLIGPRSGRRGGFCGAYQDAWQWLAETSSAAWVFQTEDDFTYEEDIDLDVLTSVMAAHLHIAQMQLRRQPWGAEPAIGGFVGQWPQLYTDRTDGTHHWLEHRRNWSTNPGLFRRALCGRGWPTAAGCEGTFGNGLMNEDPNLQFALWGKREDPPRVRHIGIERVGHSY